MTTIAEVARRAGVSNSTVSNYLNHRTDKMSTETWQKVETAIKELNYVPNLSAQSLPNKKKNGTICLLIPRKLIHLFDSMYYPTVFRAIEKLAKEKHMKILIYSRKNVSEQDDMDFLKGMAASIVDGFIIFDLSKDDLFFKEFEKLDIPYICVGKIPHYDDYNFVASDHAKAMRDSLRFLSQLGHKKIGVFLPTDSGVVRDVRWEVIKEYCESNQIDSDNIIEYSVPENSTEKVVLEKWLEILGSEDRPGAFITSSPFRNTLLIAANKLKLRIPEDISYINQEYYSKVDEGTDQTRVESRAYDIAELAFNELYSEIYYPEETKKKKHVLLPLSLIVGSTTAANNNSN